MNKIYKVIWSKVKNQYVVVSELAHSSGKQSRTSRSSIRSRIAALVVCGAIAAFGVLPMDSVSAQYIVETDRIGEGNGISIVTKDYDDDDWWKDHHYEEISVNTGVGLTIDKDTNKVVIDLASGQGIGGLGFTDDGKLKVETGAGLKIDNDGKVALNVNTSDNSGLIFDGDKLKVNTGDTLKIEDNELDVKLADNNSGLATNGGLHVDAGNGLSTETGKLAVKLDGTTLSAGNDGLKVNVQEGSGLATDGGLHVDAGDGLSTESGQLAVKLAKDNNNSDKNISGLTADNNGLKINNGDTLKIENNTLDVNLANNSGLSTEDGLKLNVDKSGFEIENGQLKNKAVMYDKGTENDLTVGKLQAKNDVVTLDDNGTQKYSLNTIGANTQGITSYNADTETTTVNGTLSASDVVAGDYGLKAIGDKTKGITYNAENKTTTVDGTLSATTISGLGNTNWDDTINENSTKAATEAQLYKATQLNVKYDVDDKSSVNFGGKAYDNKANGTRLTNVAYADVNGTDTGSDAVNVDLLKDYVAENAGSTNVKAGTNIEVKDGVVSLKPNVTLDADASDGKKIDLNGTNGTISAVNSKSSVDGPSGKWYENKTTTTNKITNTFDFSDGGKFVTEKNENTVVKEPGNVVTLYGKDITTKNTTEFNEKGATFTKEENTQQWVSDKKIPVGGPITNISSTNIDGGTITTDTVKGLSNTTWNAEKAENSNKAATEAQLYTVAGDIDALEGEVNKVGQGWTATGSDGGKTIVKPGGTLNFNGDKNIDVTADKGAINVKLNPVVTLDGDRPDGDGIVLDGERGAIYATNVNMLGVKHTVALDESGATFVRDGLGAPSATNINGGTITTDKVQGLDNTKWTKGIAIAASNKWSLEASKAATQGQLSDVDFKVNKNTHDIDDLQDQVKEAGQGWTATDSKGKTTTVEPGETLKFNGDKNIDVTADDGAVNVGLKPVVTLGGDTAGSNKVVLDGNNGSINAVNTTRGGHGHGSPTITNVFSFDKNGATFTETVKRGKYEKTDSTSTKINGGTITTDTVQGLNNTTWNEKDKKAVLASINGEDKTEATKAATQAQLLGATGAISEDLNTLNNFAVKYDKNTDGTVNKNSITLAGGESGTQIHNVKAGEAGTDAVNVSQLNSKTGDLQYNNFYDDAKSIVKNNDNLTTAVGKLDDAIQKTSETANKGWTAKVGNKDIDVKPGDTLQFKGDNNITVSATTDIFGNNAINVGLEPVVTLDGNKLDGDSIVLNGYDGTISAVNTKEEGISFIGRKITSNKFDFDNDGAKFVTVKTKFGAAVKDGIEVHTTEFNENGATFTKTSITEDNMKLNNSSTNIDGGTVTTDTVKGLSNTTWDAQNPNAYANSDKAATEAQLQKAAAASKTTVSSGDNIKVDSTQNNDGHIDYKVSLKDNITLDGTAGHINFNPDNENSMISIKDTTGNAVFNVAKDGTVSSAGNISSKGDVTAGDGAYSLTELGKYAVKYDETAFDSGTPKITLAGEKGTTIENVAAGVNDTDAVNVSQLKAVEATASAGWTAKAGNDTITVKPNQTLNFEGDGNITVSATSGTSSELKFGLKDTVVLGDAVPTEEGGTAASLALSSDGSYVPPTATDDDKSETGIIGSHGGGFILYSTNSAGNPMFGVTADGVVHAKDVISYYDDDNNPTTPSNIKYSLNDVGDIVTQIAHATFTSSLGEGSTNMEYTLISDFSGEKDKENPFVAVDENGNPTKRTIGLAVRQDGAVVVGAVVDSTGVMSNETGIRINDANTETGGGGKDTITGLSNIDWTPAAIRESISTLGTENGDNTKATIEKSKAATQGQLDDLYSSVVGYNVEGGKVNTSHVTLGGTKDYKSYESRDVNGTKTYSGGVILDNVAYAATSGDYDGSAAVNVDLLKDTVANVTSQTSESDKYLYSGSYNKDMGEITLTSADKNGNNSSSIIIGDIASRSEVNDQIASINSQIKNINTKIENIGTGGNNNTDIIGGQVDKETGNLVLEKNDGSKVEVGQLTDSAVSDVNFDKEKGTLTITNKDNYTGKESGTPITVEGIASKDDIKTVNDTIGVTSKEDLKEKYKDADTAYITDSETMVDADIALDHAVQDLASNDQYLNSRIDSVEKRLGDVEQRIDKVGAMAAAIANLRTMGFDPEAPTEIAVGVGQYKSETGLAIGVFHYPNQDFMLSASLSTSGDEVMGGIGATWRIGRKTAAEKAKDEEKRILAKAEEIKQAAKRAEVKAQADRHAKLLAEREAKGESIRPIENKVEQTQEQA